MKRILSAALVILMIAALAVTSAASAYDPPDVQLPDWMETAAPRFPFTDVHRNSWYFKYVWYAADHDLMMGRSEELFEPNGKMSRAEFVTILFRIDGASAEYTDKFSDVKKNSWYAGYVGWAVNAGIILGMTDDTFEPDSPITREQVAVILGRYVLERDIYFREDQAEIDAFTDDDKISSWAYSFVDYMRVCGIFAGDDCGRVNPQSLITRAEAATLISRFTIGVSCDEILMSNCFIYNTSAMWIMEKGFVAPNGAVEDGLYVLEDDSFTINWRWLLEDPDDTPVIRLYYKGGAGDALLKLNVSDRSANPLFPSKSYELGVTPTADGEYKVMEADLTDIMSDVRAFYAEETEKFKSDPSNGCYGDIYDYMTVTLDVNLGADDASLLVLLLSENREKIADMTLEKLKDHLLVDYTDGLFFEETTDEITERYMSEAENRIDEIMNADGIDPAEIDGTCYYISSLNGSDTNDGLSPENAWATVDNLYKSLAGGQIIRTVLNPGDGVFFERGSTFYECEKLRTDYSGNRSLWVPAGVTVSAYGEGSKPLFSHEYRMKTSAGEWSETDYANVWRLDELIIGTELCLEYRKICNVVVNGGEMYGIGVKVDDLYDPFRTGSTAAYRGVVTNGRDIFESGGNSFENIGGLCHNLEFFHNVNTGEFFMYYDGGNPGEVFRDIKLSQWGSVVSAGSDKYIDEPTVVDNIAVKYTGRHGMEVFGNNLTVQNCEVAWIGGIDIGNGIENWGSCKDYTVKNNYLYQCYDDNITSQYSGESNTRGVLMQDIAFTGNVLSHSTAAFELWAPHYTAEHISAVWGHHGSYVMQNSLVRNVRISDNYMLYMGYGFGHQRVREYDPHKGAKYLDCSGGYYQQFSNVVFENNIGIHSTEYINYIQQFNEPSNAPSNEPYSVRGIKTRNNVYIVSDQCYYTRSDLGRPMTVGRQLYDYNERTLAGLQVFGIEMGTKFYYYKGYLTEAERNTGVLH